MHLRLTKTRTKKEDMCQRHCVKINTSAFGNVSALTSVSIDFFIQHKLLSTSQHILSNVLSPRLSTPQKAEDRGEAESLSYSLYLQVFLTVPAGLWHLKAAVILTAGNCFYRVKTMTFLFQRITSLTSRTVTS